jgi:hypothetical protein
MPTSEAQTTDQYRCEIDGPHFYECKHCHVGPPVSGDLMAEIERLQTILRDWGICGWERSPADVGGGENV